MSRTLLSPRGAPPAIVSYVSGVIAMSLAACLLALVAFPAPDPLRMLFWAAVFLVGEAISFDTPTGRGRVSMAAVLHLAAFPMAPASTLMVAAGLGRLGGDLVIQRTPWYKGMFNAAQVALAVLGGALTFSALAGWPPVAITRDNGATAFPALLAAILAYYVVNHGLVCGVLALVGGSPYWRAWRENFGHRVQIVSSGALYLIAPIAVVFHQTMGHVGLLLFVLPMILIRDACRRYFELERAQRALIGSERLAAKGEMAASVAHELNNYLAVLGGNLQILQLKGAALDSDGIQSKVGKCREQVGRMSVLSKGLMDFSQMDSRPVPTDPARLVEEAIEFLQPQNRFDGVSLHVECDPRVGTMVLDPGQIQQVLMNFLNNAADAMRDAETEDRAIHVRVGWLDAAKKVELVIQDRGPGVPPDLRSRIFEPGFTTKHDGHGFGLSTAFKIVRNHGGTLSVEDAPGGGAVFRVLLPARDGHATLAAA